MSEKILFCFLFLYTLYVCFLSLARAHTHNIGCSFKKRNANVFRHLSLSPYHIQSLSLFHTCWLYHKVKFYGCIYVCIFLTCIRYVIPLPLPFFMFQLCIFKIIHRNIENLCLKKSTSHTHTHGRTRTPAHTFYNRVLNSSRSIDEY